MLLAEARVVAVGDGRGMETEGGTPKKETKGREITMTDVEQLTSGNDQNIGGDDLCSLQ